MDWFTRQIVFLWPGTFVIFDRVKSKNPSFEKTWLLQAMKTPEILKAGPGEPPILRITNGGGRLFVQTLFPRNPRTRFVSGEGLYTFDGKSFPPSRITGPAPECRIEISPNTSSREDFFLHVLTAADSAVDTVPAAIVKNAGDEIAVTIGEVTVMFRKGRPGGGITRNGKTIMLKESIMAR